MKKLALVISTLLFLTACQDRATLSDIEAKMEQKKSGEKLGEKK